MHRYKPQSCSSPDDGCFPEIIRTAMIRKDLQEEATRENYPDIIPLHTYIHYTRTEKFLRKIIGHFTVHTMVENILCRVSIATTCVFSSELLKSLHTNGKVHGRRHDTSPRDGEWSVALWTNAFRAFEGKSSEVIPPGPQSRESVHWLPVTVDRSHYLIDRCKSISSTP